MGLKTKLISLLPECIADAINKNKICGSGISLQRNGVRLNNTVIKCAGGDNNKIILSPGASLSDCSVYISGSNNTIVVSENCKLNKVKFWLEDDGNEINVGRGTTTSGECEFAVIEGTKINIGEDCMFSGKIRLSTGDSHSIISDGKRINPSRDINVGNHVWVGTQVNMLKGSKISDNSIVGTCALVTSEFNECGVAVAGIPAKIVKTNVDWKRERIEV